MNTTTRSFQQAFERIRADYIEMPGMRLTPGQVRRLSGVDTAVCGLVLEELVRTKFLQTGPDGRYARVTDGPSALRMAKADLSVRPVPPVSRRAS